MVARRKGRPRVGQPHHAKRADAAVTATRRGNLVSNVDDYAASHTPRGAVMHDKSTCVWQQFAVALSNSKTRPQQTAVEKHCLV